MESKVKELKKRIATIPPNGKWRYISNKETFMGLGEELIKKGFSVEESANFLSLAYSSIAEEYEEPAQQGIPAETLPDRPFFKLSDVKRVKFR